MESSGPPAIISKKLRHILSVVCCMIRKSFISRRKLLLDLQHFLKSGKIARKAMANTLNFNNDHRSAMAFSNNFPREVEFSCSHTPSYPIFDINRRKNRIHGHCKSYDCESGASIAAEDFNFEMHDDDDEIFDAEYSVVNSPFPVRENEVVDEKVDKKAGEFIRRFYEQLKIHQRNPMTPLSQFQRP